MRLALVPTKSVTLAAGLPPSVVPDLPASVEWAQAGNHAGWDRRGRKLVYLPSIGDSEWAGVASRPGVKVVKDGSRTEVREIKRLRDAMRGELAPQSGKVWAVRDEIVSAYRSSAVACEEAETIRESFVMLGRLVPAVVAAFLLARFGDPRAALAALTVLHLDAFTRADGSLNGSTMSDGIGTWATAGGTTDPSVVSNQCGASSTTSAYRYAYDSAMTACDVQRTTATKVGTTVAAVCARLNGSGGGGYDALYYPGYHGIWLHDTGGQVSSATPPSSGDTWSVDASGSTLTYLVNGSATSSPATDSSYATGIGGCMVNGFDGSVAKLDSWQVEVAGAATSPKFLTLLGVG